MNVVVCRGCHRAHHFDPREGSNQARRCGCGRVVTWCSGPRQKSRWELLEVD